MADTTPKKPLDRQKPFKRINNDTALARIKTAPDGDGKAAGCHLPEDIPNVEEEFKKFLDKNLPVPIIKFLEDAESTLKTIKDVIDVIGKALKCLAIIAGGGVGTPALIAAIQAFVDGLLGILEKVIQIVKDTIKGFFENIGKEILKRALRVVPQWMPVKQGASNELVGSDQIIEMEGLATRSFGNPVDVPFFQYHRWFDWNVQVAPEPDYVNARSPASDPPDAKTDVNGSETPFNKNNSFEIQFDPGALWSPQTATIFESGFSEAQTESFDGPYIQPDIANITDWVWPQAGSYVWATGRWVYDCSRVTTDKSPKMCTMINPAKAMATARWGADKLPGQAHDLAVPVIDFMFVADKRGGYINFDKLDDQDYEFIVDLPPGPGDASPYPVGHTGDINGNTIVLRQQLLQKLTPLSQNDALLIKPKVEPIFGDDPKQPPQQVKVTVPLSTAKEGKSPAVGFILTMGWFDADGSQAEKVRLCTLTLDQFSGRKQLRDDGVNTLRKKFKSLEDDLRKKILDAIDDIDLPVPDILKDFLKLIGVTGFKVKDLKPLADAIHSIVNGIIDELFKLLSGLFNENEEWLLHFGLNGRLKNLYDDHVDSKPKALKRAIKLGPIAVSDDDQLTVTIGGTEFNPIGDMMRTAHLRRVLTKDNVELTWSQICNADTQLHKDLVFQYVVKMMFNDGKLLLGIDNEPLGLVDPGATTGCAIPNDNPIVIKNAALGAKPVSYSAIFARAASDQAVLVEDSNKCDYTISGTLEIAKQKT